MKHSEVLKIITMQIGREPTQREIADILNIPTGTINSRASRNLHYSYDEIVELEDYYGIRFNQIEKVPTRHSELMKMITKQTGEEPKTKDIAEILGLTQEAIRSRAFRDKEYSYAEVEKLKKYYKIPFRKTIRNAVDVKTTLQYIKTLIEDLEQSL
jgi:hypothetical protein